MRPVGPRAVRTRRWPLWVVALIGMGLPVARAGAECLRREPGWLWNYEGTLGTAGRARMTLVIDGERVSGVYALAGSATDVILTGRLTAGRMLVLEGRDATGRRTVRLTGTFPTRDPSGRLGESPLTCDVIAGTWESLGTPTRVAVLFALQDGTAGSLTHRYAALGVTDDAIINHTALRCWVALRDGDRQTMADLVAYPLTVVVGGRRIRLRTRAQFLARYEAIVTPRLRAAVLASVPRHLFVRDQGAMLGAGDIWIGATGLLVAINP